MRVEKMRAEFEAMNKAYDLAGAKMETLEARARDLDEAAARDTDAAEDLGEDAVLHSFGIHFVPVRQETERLAEARRGGQFGLMTVCAAGGLGFAMVIER